MWAQATMQHMHTFTCMHAHSHKLTFTHTVWERKIICELTLIFRNQSTTTNPPKKKKITRKPLKYFFGFFFFAYEKKQIFTSFKLKNAAHAQLPLRIGCEWVENHQVNNRIAGLEWPPRHLSVRAAIIWPVWLTSNSRCRDRCGTLTQCGGEREEEEGNGTGKTNKRSQARERL